MDTNRFVEWLTTTKGMGARSAKDVVSRCGRVSRMLAIEEINEKAISSLIENSDFQNSSTFVKSQLQRAVSLYLEFSTEQEKV